MRGRRNAGNWLQSLPPERMMALGFGLLILLGAALLVLPAASVSGQSIGMGAALFTSVSAVCVTGLVAVDTGTTFSCFGQVVLILLIQLGGLGFMVFATLIMVALGRRITLRNRLLIRESINTSSMSGVVRLSLRYGALALMIEAGGAALLSIRLIPRYGVGRGIAMSVWHGVSAFCNAGFDLFGNYGSLTGFAQDPLVLLVISLLVLLGGTGFAVICEVIAVRFRWKRMSLHTRLALALHGLLLAAGAAFFALVEWTRPATLGSMPAWDRAVNALFQSVTMRTAGFNSIPLEEMAEASRLFSVLLMFIGAAPASTGGGVKVTTVAVVLLTVRSVMHGDEDITVMHRRLPPQLVRRALAIAVTAMTITLTGAVVLSLLEHGRYPMMDLIYECTSALATVGVSSIGTPNLTGGSRAVLAVMMFLGRVGPLTMASALTRRQGRSRTKIRCPEEQITIG